MMHSTTPRSRRSLPVALSVVAAAALVSACSLPGAPFSGGGKAQDTAEVGAVSKENADAIVNAVVSKVAALTKKPGDGSGFTAVYEPPLLKAAQASGKLAVAKIPTPGWPAMTVTKGGAMAVSQGTTYPRYVLAQTTVPKQVPVLHLIMSGSAGAPYRISHSAALLAGASVKALPSMDNGAPIVTDGEGLPVAPTELVEKYATSLSRQVNDDDPFEKDAFGEQVRSSINSKKAAVAASADYAVSFKPVSDRTVAVKQAGGDALVFSLIERVASYRVKPDQQLNPPPEFVTLSEASHRVLFKEATSTTLQVVVFSVPTEGKASVIAAAEQMISASGQ